ncbi:MAG: MarR family transcriptional regulator [Jatrophihabitans sp.]
MTTSERPQHTAPPDEQTAEIASRVRLIVGRLTRQLRLHPAGDGLTSTQLATLATIERCEPLRIGDLASAEGISAATMTRVVATLAEHGLVERRTDPDDGRACQVLLSPHGNEEVRRLRSQRTGYLAIRLDACTPEQRATLAAALPVLELIAQDPPVEA